MLNSLALVLNTLRKFGVITVLIKALGRISGRRVLVEHVDLDFPKPLLPRDLSMPTSEDAQTIHLRYRALHNAYPCNKYLMPLPNDRMMLHVGAPNVENFFAVGDAWAHVLSRFISPSATVMDAGCGCGRTARFLALNANMCQFIGFDVIKPYVDWCQHFFGAAYPGRFQFHHLDVKSERYNPTGVIAGRDARFPAGAGTVDLFYAGSLFTHLFPEDAKGYAVEIARVLNNNGHAVVSFHDAPSVGEKFTGDEHQADYAADYFVELMEDAGLTVVEDLAQLCSQRTYVLVKNSR
jgi:SAM-dependent methyltransferase